jgi:hypothetical protein
MLLAMAALDVDGIAVFRPAVLLWMAFPHRPLEKAEEMEGSVPTDLGDGRGGVNQYSHLLQIARSLRSCYTHLISRADRMS